jgi:hypothetical protein
MKTHLNDYQSQFAHLRMAFGNMLSAEVAESVRRASLACAENEKKETGIIEFFCGLYLQDPKEFAVHFQGDLAAVVSRTFPIHRFGEKGQIPQAMLDNMTGDVCSGGGEFGYTMHFSRDLLRLLWLSARMANALGKKASFKDIVAAVTLDGDWMDELQRSGLALTANLADFDGEVRTIVFYTSVHTGEGWPRKMDFDRVETLQPPFTLEVTTPSGPFQPVRSAKVKLNGSEVCAIAWPEKPNACVGVELQSSNKIEFEIDGPPFGSVDVTIRGVPT